MQHPLATTAEQVNLELHSCYNYSRKLLSSNLRADLKLQAWWKFYKKILSNNFGADIAQSTVKVQNRLVTPKT